jgi:GTPase SAR1 family protein
MKIVKQKYILEIENFDNITNSENSNLKHGPLFPASIRCIISGPSNCGKTNVMISLLQNINGLRFENVYIYSKSLYQPKYEYLRNMLNPITGLGFYQYDTCEKIMHPSEAKKNSVFIFDDVACSNQSVIRDYFSMGRHNSIDSFYLCQSYTHIPKHLIRDNANMLILFKQDDLNLKHVYDDHVNTDMSFTNFKKICFICWKDEYGFLVIDKDSNINLGRYRKGFHYFIQI